MKIVGFSQLFCVFLMIAISHGSNDTSCRDISESAAVRRVDLRHNVDTPCNETNQSCVVAAYEWTDSNGAAQNCNQTCFAEDMTIFCDALINSTDKANNIEECIEHCCNVSNCVWDIEPPTPTLPTSPTSPTESETTAATTKITTAMTTKPQTAKVATTSQKARSRIVKATTTMTSTSFAKAGCVMNVNLIVTGFMCVVFFMH